MAKNETLERRHIMVSTGSLPSAKVQLLARSYPFIKKLDVVFPSSPELEVAFSQIETSYSQGEQFLSKFYEDSLSADLQAQGKSQSFSSALCEASETEDTWCIDQRVGERLPFKGSAEQYIVHIPLTRKTDSLSVRQRQKEALKTLDRIREEAGLGMWDILCLSGGRCPLMSQKDVEVPRVTRKMVDVYVPEISFQAGRAQDGAEKEEWNEKMSELFEWVGMACLGAQRLQASDRVNPYVAVYEPPTPSYIGDVTHLSWSGFLGPAFLQSVIDAASVSLSSTTLRAQTNSPRESFIAITALAFTSSPVSYIPPVAFETAASSTEQVESPLRAPRDNGDDTMSLVLTSRSRQDSEGDDYAAEVFWIKGECIGKWDLRWG